MNITLARPRRTSLASTLLVAAVALFVAGCPSEPDLLVSHLSPLEDAVLAVDETNARARIVQLDEGADARVDVTIGEGPATVLQRHASGNDVLLFTGGRPAEEDEEGSVAELVRVARDGLRDFEGLPVAADAPTARWRFSDQYASVRLTGEERYAMAYAPVGRLVVDNRVEIADLDAAPSATNPVGLSLRSLGGEVPTDVAVSRPLSVGAGNLRVVALLAPGQLSLFDLDAPSLAPVTIPTGQVPGTTGPRPVEAVFVGQRIVVRTEGGTQLVVVSLTAADPGDGGQRFDVSISTLLTSEPVHQLVVDERATTPRLLALAGSAMHVFDLEAGLRETVVLPSVARSALAFEGTAPGDPVVRDRMALYGPSSDVVFVDFGSEPLDILSVFRLPLDFVPSEITPDTGGAQLVAFRAVASGGHPLDVAESRERTPSALIDLDDRSATPLSTTSIDRSVLSDDLTVLWVADQVGYVSRFDTRALTQDEGWIGRPVEFLLPLPGARGLVLAFTDPYAGTFTVMDRAVADPGAWQRRRGAF